MEVENRRSASRLLACIPAYFESHRDSQDLALIRDVSVTGARLYTRIRLEVGQEVTLHLYLGKESEPPKHAAGRVVRADRRNPALSDVWPWEIGVEFATPIESYEKEIEELCRRQEAAGILKR